MTAAAVSRPFDWRTTLRVRCQSLCAPFMARRAAPRERRFHAFAVGLPRSGTHSLAAMFGARFRTAHEPALVDTLAHTMSWNRGERTPARMGALLRWRDRRLNLELEAAHYLHHLAPLLVAEFPEARFVLTLRDPVSWIESELNQNIRSAGYPFWRALEQQRYGRYGADFPAPERDLAAAGCLHPIGSYLCYWRDHIDTVVQAVPADRLLILRTDQIGERLTELTQFLGVDDGMVDQSQSRSGVGGDRSVELRRHLADEYLRDQVERHCLSVVREWFPEQG